MHPFAHLPESEQIARLLALASRALAAWGLAGASVEPIKYRENAVFRVTDPHGTPRVLRVHRAGFRSDDEIRSEVAWMRALGDAGVPTPAFLPTREGDVLAIAETDDVPEPRQCDLAEWVAGEPLGSLEHGVDAGETELRATYRTVGEIAARIHAHGTGWKRPDSFVRPTWDADSLVGDDPAFGRFWDAEELVEPERGLLLAARQRARERLRKLGPPTLLGHGDLIPDNLLANQGRVRVIDFDDCGWSSHGLELTTAIFPLLISGGFDVGLEAFLAGYRSVRPFPEADLAALPTFVMARALSYLGWPVGRPEIVSQRALVPFMVTKCAEFARLYLEPPSPSAAGESVR